MYTSTSLKCAAVLLPALAVGMPTANASDEKRDDQKNSAKTSYEFGTDSQYQSKDTTPAHAYLGHEIMSKSNDESIGEISNLLVTQDGRIVAAIVSVGGTLGLGEREVAIAWDQIERSVDGDELTLTTDMTKESLEDVPSFSSETKYSSGDKNRSDQGQDRHDYSQDGNRSGQPATASANSSAYKSDENKSDANKSDSYAYESDANKSDEYGSDESSSDEYNTDEYNTDENESDSYAYEADENASDEYSSDANEIESDANELAHGQFLANLPARGFHSDNLVGQEVTSRSNNESIGEVSDLVLDENGQVVAAIISVGGVMGLGEREIAISWDQIERSVDGDEIKLTTDLTEENLENAPKYQNEEDDQTDM